MAENAAGRRSLSTGDVSLLAGASWALAREHCLDDLERMT